MTDEEYGKILIPMIRKVLPAVIASDIVGVQPMQTDYGSILEIKPKYLDNIIIVDQTKDKLPEPPAGYLTVDVSIEVSRWIQEQAISQWKFATIPAYGVARERFTISEELYTMAVLKWS